MKEKLKILGICSVIFGVLKVVWIVGFMLLAQFTEFGRNNLNNSGYVRSQVTIQNGSVVSSSSFDDASMPKPFKSIINSLEMVGTFMQILGIIVGVLTVFAGICILQQKGYTFTLVIAALNGLSIPIGTLLAVFTFILLIKPEVKEIYGRSES